MGIAMGVIAVGVLIAFHGYEGLLMTDDPFYKRKDIGTIPLDRVLAAAYVTYSLVMATPLVLAGRGLLQWKPWARTGAMLTSALNMLLFPIGTAAGIYAI